MASTEKMAAVTASVVRPELTCRNHHSAATSWCNTCTRRMGTTMKKVMRFASTRLRTNLQTEQQRIVQSLQRPV
jgi:hypothetical protein